MTDAETVAALLTKRTARGIAVETGALIRSGALPVGCRLPTVRDLAFRLGVSPATVSEAWSELRRQKMISGRGRNGAFVSGDTMVHGPSRLASAGSFQPDVLNLAVAGPDPTLLPPLSEALAHAATTENLNSYERTPILDELRQAVEARWPYDAEMFLATNGGFNAIYVCLHALVMPGAPIAIEDPTAMRLLDIIEDLGAQIIPVERDEEGPLPQSLAAALERRPAAFIYQPRTHSVTGEHVSPRRLDEMAALLQGRDTLVIEDDGLGDISPHPPLSLGGKLPDRVVHILSFSKSLGPDLRLGVLSSSRAIVRQVQSYRSFSAGWTSRLLQAAGAWLLGDQASLDIVDQARDVYADRRAQLSRALASHGIAHGPGEGLCLLVPVQSESFALVTLAARGISVLPGSKCSVRHRDFVRVAISMLADGHEFVAESLAIAARGSDAPA
jgi:DNA-binding transcriptional MocR family regulator